MTKLTPEQLQAVIDAESEAEMTEVQINKSSGRLAAMSSMKGVHPEQLKKALETHCRQVKIGDIVFESIKDAAEAIGRSAPTIKRYLDNGYFDTPRTMEEVRLAIPTRKQKVKGILITIDGKVYKSVKALAKAADRYIDVVKTHLDNGYFDTPRTMEEVRLAIPVRARRSKIVLDGVGYESLTAASIARGTSVNTIKRWVKAADDQKKLIKRPGRHKPPKP